MDPLFLYAACVSAPLMCVFLDAWFAAAVTALRCAVDAAHAWNLVLRVRDASAAAPRRREGDDADEERPPERDCGGAVAAARARPSSSSRKSLLLDVFVILPVMQVRATLSAINPHLHSTRSIYGEFLQLAWLKKTTNN